MGSGLYAPGLARISGGTCSLTGFKILYTFFCPLFFYGRDQKELFYSSFFNHPNTLIYILIVLLTLIPRLAGLLLIDCRDSGFRQFDIKSISSFGLKFIACSLNVNDALLKAGVAEQQILHVPVPHDTAKCSDDKVAVYLTKTGLVQGQYIAYAGLIKKEKNVDLLVKAFKRYREIGGTIPRLVLAGLMKDAGSLRDLIDSEPAISYVGNLRQDDVRALFAGAALVVNPSPIEGMPRSSLEAITQCVPVILPPNIPEFASTDASLIAGSDVDGLCALMLSQTVNQKKATYSVTVHDSLSVLAQYNDLIL